MTFEQHCECGGVSEMYERWDEQEQAYTREWDELVQEEVEEQEHEVDRVLSRVGVIGCDPDA